MVGVLVAGGGDRRPSQPCQGTLEQGTEPPNAPMCPVMSWRLCPHAAGLGSIALPEMLEKCDFLDGSVDGEPMNLLQLRFGVTGAL